MKGYALLVGMNKVDQEHYDNDKALCSSLQDTINVLASIDKKSYEYINTLNDTDTNWSNVKKELAKIADLTEANQQESYVFLYFSGHGASIKVDGFEEEKQFICFYDRLILENQIQEQLSFFNRRCKVFVVVDTCYSEGLALPVVIEVPYLKGRSKSLPAKTSEEVYRKYKKDYQKDVVFYSDKKFKSESEICYLFACGKTEVTLSGQSCKESSEFTTEFLSAWKFAPHKKFYNYFSFFKHLRESPKSQVKMLFPSKNKSSFFMTTYPLTSNINIMNSPIILEEDHPSGEFVDFSLDSTVQEHSMLHSITFTIDANDKIHSELVARVEKFDSALMDNVKCMSLIFITKVVGTGSTNLPEPIRGLKKLDSSTSHGVVLTVDKDLNLLHKPKRTKGKVTNVMG